MHHDDEGIVMSNAIQAKLLPTSVVPPVKGSKAIGSGQLYDHAAFIAFRITKFI